MLVYEPKKRITPEEALNHPFITNSSGWLLWRAEIASDLSPDKRRCAYFRSSGHTNQKRLNVGDRRSVALARGRAYIKHHPDSPVQSLSPPLLIYIYVCDSCEGR
jgi:hypothetical protein